jgi:hypothetical protein
VAGDVDFTSEDLIEHLAKQQILARELKGVKPEKVKKYAGVEANEMTSGNAKAIGICYDFQSEEGCLRKNCRFRHEELPTNPRTDTRQSVPKTPTKHSKCRRCAKEGHRGEDCPERKALTCSFCGKKGHCEEACLKKAEIKTPVLSRRGGKGTARGRGGRGAGRGKGGVHANAVEIEGLEPDDTVDESLSEDSEPEYRGTMVLQTKVVNANAISSTHENGEVRLMIDSGCDALAMIDQKDGYDLRPARVLVNEATEGSTATVDCKGNVDLELPMGGKLEVKGAIFSKNFRHNLIGTSTLGQAGISTLMHEGKVYLIDEKSVKQLPKNWKIRACEGVDRETGLPFITMKRVKPLWANTAQSVEAPRQQDKDRAVTINANRKAPRDTHVHAHLAKTYARREGSHKSEHEWRLAHRAMGHPGKKVQAKTMGIAVPEGNQYFCEDCALGSGKFSWSCEKTEEREENPCVCKEIQRPDSTTKDPK